MVGGEVIGVTRYKNGVVRVTCSEWIRLRGGGRKRDDRNAAYVKVRAPEHGEIRVGDQLWWQGRWAMWTPVENCTEDKEGKLKCGVDYDIRLERIGFSAGANL